MSPPREDLASRHPEHFFLDPAAPDALDQHLTSAGLLESDERVRVLQASEQHPRCGCYDASLDRL